MNEMNQPMETRYVGCVGSNLHVYRCMLTLAVSIAVALVSIFLFLRRSIDMFDMIFFHSKTILEHALHCATLLYDAMANVPVSSIST